jgi:acetate kinase
MKVLVLNCGSSSVKFELFESEPEQALADGLAERVGQPGAEPGMLHYTRAGNDRLTWEKAMPDHRQAIAYIVEALTSPEHGVLGSIHEVGAVGHRVVHGGEDFSASTIIDDEVLAVIERNCELAPLHNPPNLTGILACRELLPSVPQVAVFDTAFHAQMPRRAYLYGIPYSYYENLGIRRYGFHGTSHRYVTGVALEYLAGRGKPVDGCKIVTCHLGNGCSMAAVVGGRSIDTTMGFTPLEGLLMGTRSGDLDPAIVTFLVEHTGGTAGEVYDLLNKRSGLLGISGVSNDMRDLLEAAEGGNARAAAAIEVFCYRIKKYIGAYAAAMGGLDAVVFTGGIGENAVDIRRRCVEGLDFLGLRLDEGRNSARGGEEKVIDVSMADAPARVLVIPTNEELLIARDTARLVGTR